MMRGQDKYCVAVRLPGGGIDIFEEDLKPAPGWQKVPVLRGVFSYISSLQLGYKALMRSADLSMPEEESGPGKIEIFIKKHFGAKGSEILTGVSAVLGGSLALVLFMVLPTIITGFINNFILLGGLRTPLESILKLAIFILYVALCSQMKEIYRLFCYHGAEHKTIACYEAGEELTVENVKKHSRFHPRCGTSFLMVVLLVSIALFSLLPWGSTLVRVVQKLVLLPLVMGFSFEIIRFTGRHGGWFAKIVAAPGLLMQRLTTHEPTDDMIEVAIAAVLPVLPKNMEDTPW